MLTGENITDEQIRELRETAWDWFDMPHERDGVFDTCSLALAKFRHVEGRAAIRGARARCAEILNARAKAGAR